MTPDRVPANATPEGDGIVVGAGPVTVDAFIDFLCPFCRQFELSSGERLAAMAVDGQISLAYHPMNFLDAASTTRYSTRAAAASGCAADGGRVPGYVHALFVDQPAEGSAGLSDDRLVELGVAAGLSSAEFGEGVRQGRYLDWPSYVTERATAAGVSGTPTVLVGGAPVPANVRMITAAVARVAG